MGISAGRSNRALSPTSPAAAALDSSMGALDSSMGGYRGGEETMEESGFGEGVVDREEVLGRYRRLREISRNHGDAILTHVSKKALFY